MASEPKAPTKKDSQNSGTVPVWRLFKFADTIDIWLMILGTAGAIGDGCSMPVLMIIMSHLLDVIGTGANGDRREFIDSINEYSLYMVYVAGGVWVAAFLEAYCWTRTGDRQVSRMRKAYLRAVLRQDVGFYDTQGTTTSDVVTSVSNDSVVIQDVLGEKLPNFIMNTAFFISTYIVAFIIAWRLAIVAFPFILLLIIPGLMYGRILVGISRKMMQSYSVAGNVAQQALSAIKTVYSFVAEDKTQSRFSEALNETVKFGIKQGLVKGMAIGSTGVTFGIWAFVSWYGSTLVMYHGVSGGKIFVTGACLIMGGLALGTGLPNLRYFSEAGAAAKRIFDMVDRVPLIDIEDSQGETLDIVSGEVEFRNVDFAYPSRPDSKIFDNFCLRIPASMKVALVGGSGSGKSTAIALIERFYDPLGGEILLDGVNIKKLHLKRLRSQIGLVSQEPALFATSIKENILFGKDGATLDEVIVAAKAANAHNFISQLPHGYDTQVGESGAQMSGGQKQRIAIARAILKNPPLLLLDEATSALDAESEKIVQQALDMASVGRTTVIVAHRLSTIRNADIIAVVNSGQIEETGNHEELITREHGTYATLVQLQQTAAEKGDGSMSMREMSLKNRSIKSLSYNESLSSSTRSVEGMEIEKVDKTIPPPSFKRLLAMNAPEWRQALLGCVGAMTFGAVQPIYSYVMGTTVSVFFLTDHGEMKEEITTYALVFTALGVVSFVVNVLQHYNFAAMGEHLTKRIRERMFAEILTFEVGWFDKDENSSGAICSRLASEANVVRSLVGDRAALVVQTLSAVVVAYTMGIAIAWKLALVIIAVQPVIIACFYLRKTLMKLMSHKALKAQEKGSQLAAEAVTNHRTVTAFSSQDKILRLFQNVQAGPDRDSIKQSWIAGLVLGTAQAISMCNLGLDFWYGGHLLYRGEIKGKNFFQTFFILMTTGRVIADAASMTSDLAKGTDAVRSVFMVLDRLTQIEPDDTTGEKPDKIEGTIEVRNVEFAYPARPEVTILNKFSLRIKAGTSMALVGQSGSGKSTIIGLIERFYDPSRGSIRIDGVDVRKYNLRALRGHIALVGQEPTLFGGTIRENIMYGKRNATEAEVVEAAKAANAHDFISTLQDGYDTYCGDRGLQLSGGQKQRIAIARAIVKNPSILLLDEATSALDSQSEKVVQEALDRLMVGRTTVLVAHRLTTVQNAHCIAVVQDGVVVEQGTHSYLLCKGDGHPYYNLVHMHGANNSQT